MFFDWDDVWDVLAAVFDTFGEVGVGEVVAEDAVVVVEGLAEVGVYEVGVVGAYRDC